MSSSSTMSEKVIIHLWCCPRTLSTATMYSFAQRPDCKVFDEPLYASHLSKNPQLFRPYREELLVNKEICDGNYVLEKLPSYFSDKINVIVCKHITKQIQGIDHSALFKENDSYRIHHVFLIRNPLDIIMSWNDRQEVHKEGCNLEGLCFPQMVQLYSEIKSRQKSTSEKINYVQCSPIVIDSNLLKSHASALLPLLCTKLRIPFYQSQLSWPAGPKKDIDGLWAPYWYAQVHQSTGFINSSDYKSTHSSKLGYSSFDVQSLEVYRNSLPFYDLLHRQCLGIIPSSFNPHSSCPELNIDMQLEFSSTSASTDNVNPLSNKIVSNTGIDARNENILVWIGDTLLPRELARVSVFDSAVQGGDAVWEGLRVYNGKIFKLDAHLHRLYDSAKALAFKNIPSVDFILMALKKTLQINGMLDHVHIRLTLTRGVKVTSSMNPNFNMFGTTLIILPEWKPVVGPATYDNEKGIALITATGRRHPADTLDSKIHHCNLLNNILPKIQANNAGAADAVMLDKDGYVAETNATNLFMVKDNVLYTPAADVCLPGVTRQTVMEIARKLNITVVEKLLSLVDFYTADEVFTTGTMGELTKVNSIDNRQIGPNIVDKKHFSTTISVLESNIDSSILKVILKDYQKLTEIEGYNISV